MLKVGVTELDIVWGDAEETKKRCIAIMEQAYKEGVELLVFPEMTLTGYTMEPHLYGETYKDGRIPDSISFFMKHSKKYNMAIAFGYIETAVEAGSEDGEIYRNKLALVEGDNLILDYAKIHPFSYSGEDKVYCAGDKVCQAMVKDMVIGGYICYDLRFPEIFSFVRDMYNTILVIASWPKERVGQWELLLAARAVENQAYVIGVNRIGHDINNEYVASSHVYDCYGNDISKRVSENLLVAQIDSEFISNARNNFPQRNDRRNTFYKGLS